jgi:ribosome biogenesis protein ENP2
LSFHSPSCDLFIAATSADVYRFNLERGQFLQPFTTSASCVNSIEVNPEHHLLCVGTQEGTVEAWDPRDKRKCATLDVAMKITKNKLFPSVTSMKFKNGLQMAVGTGSGHTLIYDMRANEPMIIKDHLNQLPVKKVDFNVASNTVYSMDSAMLKIWDETTVSEAYLSQK